MIPINYIRHPEDEGNGYERNLDDLISSIKERGLIYPIIVRPKGSYFEIVAGNRRFEACKRLGWKFIPCIIEDIDDKDALLVNIIENLQRENLDPVTEAELFKKYIDKYGWGSTSDLAKNIGKSVGYVSQRLALLKLPDTVKDMLRANIIKPSVARELVRLKDVKKQKEMGTKLIGVTVRQSQDLLNLGNYEDNERYLKFYRKAILILKTAITELNVMIEMSEKDSKTREDLLTIRSKINESVDQLYKLMKLRKRG
ncbi:MAG: ParB/RepB/Spo0J family partition protein [bacterium]